MSESWDPNDYELIERVWVDLVAGGNEDSIFVELVNGKARITLMHGDHSPYLEFEPGDIKRLRNALTRLLARLPKEATDG